MRRLALWTYRLLLRGALPLAAPVLWVRDRVAGKGRPALRYRLGFGLPPMDPGGLWIQAVSVGEVEVARRLVAELNHRRPDLPLLVTATTATGLALARRTLAGRAAVTPCPLDLGRPVRRVLRAAGPRALVLVETEIWPEMLHQAGRRGIPSAVVNARLSKSSFTRYLKVRPLLEPLLEPLALVAARAETDAERFAALGVPEARIRVTGNIKYDLEPDPAPLEWEERVRHWAGERPLLVAGSTMEGEEAAVLEAVETAGGWERLFLVLAPRHPERFDPVAQMLRERGVSLARRSAVEQAPARPDVLLLDTIGELGRAYRLGFAAFVGGSLVPTGGHNPLEPAVYGVPVVTGPKLHNFSEVYAELITKGGAVVVWRGEELGRQLASWMADPAAAREVGEAARRVVVSNRGAAGRTVELLLGLLEETAP